MKQKTMQRIKIIAVIAFILIYALATYVTLRGNYLEYKELGEKYLEIFYKNVQYKYIIMISNFVILFIMLYFTNRGIKKGLKPFFEAENKPIPKLPNKSLAFIISAIASIIFANAIFNKLILCISNTSFQINDIVFNMDISYYMFIKPLIHFCFKYIIIIILGLSAYMAIYYIVVFNVCFEAVDRELLKNSLLIKKILRNVIFLSIATAALIVLDTQDVLIEKFMKLENGVELIGAGYLESTVKVAGYIGFAIVIVIVAIISVKYFKKRESKKVLTTLTVIPAYLVGLFLVLSGYDMFFVKPNEFDKEKAYIQENINNTREAYNIKTEDANINYSGTITEEEISENQNIINNIPIISENIVLKNLEDTQTEKGYYTYRNANIAKYEINGETKVVYISPREIENSSIFSYNNKTYEYTHGMGEIVVSATSVTDTGNIEYIQKSLSGSDDVLNIEEPRIYYGLETNVTAVTNTKNKYEYDYTDENGLEYVYTYKGESGLQVGFADRLVLALSKGDLKLATSSAVTNNSKILINRNIRERAKAVLPYIMYDENPYTVIGEDGKVYWVLDGYTSSDKYPCSNFTTIQYEGIKKEINYIRNSVKVIINAYDGSMKFYITDRTDPIIMAYARLYPSIFEEENSKISQKIQEQLIYPEFLYKIQSNILEVYHNAKPDVLYRNTDVWSVATYNTTTTTKGQNRLEPYYTMIKEPNKEKGTFGIIQMYTPSGKSNIISYLFGTIEGGENKLKIYKYSTDSNILGAIQLDSQIEQDETIEKELETLNTVGSKLTKEMKIIPINNTLLYVETIYQTKANEDKNAIPMLKKIVLASGNKVAIGDSISSALTKLLSKSAVDINISNTEDIDNVIEEIINTKKNLNESLSLKDWEIIGADINQLQNLIDRLEQLKKDQEKNSNKNNNTVTNTVVNNAQN